jgi:putative tricarboxylic transport membrane protein
MEPGPLMLLNNQVEIYSLIWALTASCIIASFIGLLLARPLAKLTYVDTQLLAPLIIVVSLVGSYAIDLAIENVVLSMVFGVIGYFMIRFDYPRITLVIALVLGDLAERNYQQSMLISDGNWSVFLTRTTSLVLVIGIIMSFVWPVISSALRKRKAQRALATGAKP